MRRAIFKRRKREVVANADYARMWILGQYNAERARGVVHSMEWRAFMATLQKRFDEAQE